MMQWKEHKLCNQINQFQISTYSENAGSTCFEVVLTNRNDVSKSAGI